METRRLKRSMTLQLHIFTLQHLGSHDGPTTYLTMAAIKAQGIGDSAANCTDMLAAITQTGEKNFGCTKKNFRDVSTLKNVNLM